MGFWSSVGSFFSGCVSAVGSLCSSIGGAIMGGISALAPVIVPHLSFFAAIIGIIASLLTDKPEKEEPEEIGMKAEEAPKKPEDFDSVGEYLDYLRNEIEVDSEKLKKLSPEDKAKYQTIGLGLYLKDIEEKYKLEMTPDFINTLPTLDKNGYKPEDMAELIKGMKERGLDSGSDFTKYLAGDLVPGSKEQRQVYGSVKNMVEKHFAGTTTDIDAKIDSLKEDFKQNL